MVRPATLRLFVPVVIWLLVIGGPAPAVGATSKAAAQTQYSVSGTVRDFDGTPLAGVPIFVIPSLSPSATTDVNGAYRLSLPAGTYGLAVFKPGYPPAPSQQVTVPPARVDVNFTFPQRFAVSGVVRDFDGTPLPGASVFASNLPGGSATTDASGGYRLSLTAGSYTVAVSRFGFPAPIPQQVTVPPARNDLNFTFPQRFTVSGVVRDFDGAPLAGVLVRARNVPGIQAMTDASGAYSLSFIAGTYALEATKAEYPSPPPRQVIVPPGHDNVGFTFPQRFTVRGVVRDWDGVTALAGVAVFAADDTTGSNIVFTNAQGAFTLAVGPGTHPIVATKAGYPDAAPVAVTVPPERTGVSIVMPDPRLTLAGTTRLWLRLGSVFERRPPTVGESVECSGLQCPLLTWRATLRRGGAAPAHVATDTSAAAGTAYTLNIVSATAPFTATLKLRRGAQETVLAQWSGSGQVQGAPLAAGDNDILELSLRWQPGVLRLSECGTAGCVGSTLTVGDTNFIYLPITMR